MKQHRMRIGSAFVAVLCVVAFHQSLAAEELRGGFDEFFGPLIRPDIRQAQPEVKPSPRPERDLAAPIRHWNRTMVDASGRDHTPVPPGESRVFGEQLGPGRSSKAMGIVHLAVFEAVNAIEGGYQSYIGARPAPFGTSMAAEGIAQGRRVADYVFKNALRPHRR